jgi:uncharacterized protein (DUF302 family)
MTKRAAMLIVACLLLGAGAGQAQTEQGPLSGTRVVATRYAFDTLLNRVEAAVMSHQMLVVAEASASKGAAGRGIKIPGNAVVMVFRNDFAIRMLEASIPAGIEAPLRIYVTENADGTATITYRTATAVFQPYHNTKLDALAGELDQILEAIVAEAAKN